MGVCAKRAGYLPPSGFDAKGKIIGLIGEPVYMLTQLNIIF